jgi:hypothetical protein
MESTDYYRKIEAGQVRPSREYLLELARLLRFTESEYIYVHLQLFSSYPVDSLHPDAEASISPAWQRALEKQQEMAYIYDKSFNLRLYNEAFTSMFPSGDPPANMMSWMLLSGEARDFCLVGWDTEWAPHVMSLFSAALAVYQDDPVLQKIQEEVLADQRASRLFERARSEPHIDSDGQRRPLRHAVKGPGYATMLASQPLTAPGARFITMLFDPEPSARG